MSASVRIGMSTHNTSCAHFPLAVFFVRSGVREVENEELLIRELRARIKSEALEIFTGPPASESNKLAAHAQAFANAAVIVGTSSDSYRR